MTTEPQPQLLVVEDDEGIGSPLSVALRAQGYTVTWSRTAAAARGEIERGLQPELVLLDLGLPDLDGVELCRWLRGRLPGSVLVMLTARDAEVDVVVGLDAGADDYITKPFRFAELLARLRAHLRRQAAAATRGDERHGTVLEAGGVVLDLDAHRCRIAGSEVDLRPKEFDLLAALVRAAGRARSREQLMAEVWDENWYGPTKTLDVHIALLRRRLSDHGLRPEMISTIRGYGYRFELPR